MVDSIDTCPKTTEVKHPIKKALWDGFVSKYTLRVPKDTRRHDIVEVRFLKYELYAMREIEIVGKWSSIRLIR